MQVDLEKKRSIKDDKKVGYDFKVISQHSVKNKCVQITPKRRLNISEISTVDITAQYRNGNVRQETLIPRVPTFLWDCFTPLFNCIQKNADINSEMFRKPGSGRRQRDFYHKHQDMHVRGCSFERSGLSPLDIAEMMKAFIRERLEPIFFDGDPVLAEIDELLSNELGVEFDLDASPEFGTLLFVVKFLHAMCLKDPTAKRLTPDNLARVFAPNFIQVQHQSNDIGCETKQNDKHIDIIAKLIAKSQNLVMKEAHMKRVRSSSISIDRMKKAEDSRRSSSLLGRFMRYAIKERARKVYGVEISSLQTSSSSTPDGRQSRPRQKKRTPNPSLRREIQYSLEQSDEASRRLSLRENRVSKSPTGSVFSLSPQTRSTQLSQMQNDVKNFLLGPNINISMLTHPPGEETLLKDKGVLDSEISYKLPTPQMEVGDYRSFYQGISDGSSDMIASEGSDDVSVDSRKPLKQTTYKSYITLPSSEDSKPFIPQVETTSKKEKVASVELPTKPLMTSLSSDMLFKPPYPAPRKNKAATNIKKSTVADDDFKVPFPITGRSRSKSKFEKENFGEDMACIIMSSGTQEDLDTKAKLVLADRPSLALLKEQRRVTQQVAKLEKQNSVDERNSPKWPPRNSPKSSSSHNFFEAPLAAYSDDSLM